MPRNSSGSSRDRSSRPAPGPPSGMESGVPHLGQDYLAAEARRYEEINDRLKQDMEDRRKKASYFYRLGNLVGSILLQLAKSGIYKLMGKK